MIEIFKNNTLYSFIKEEPYINSFIDTYFIDELHSKNSLNNDPAYKYYLELFFSLHNSERHKFQLNGDQFRKLVIKIVESEGDVAKANDYAQHFPDEEICKQVILKFQERQPKFVRHSQETELLVTENKNISEIDSSTGLFKSTQEYYFYKAVREIFPTFLVFPNVAVSAIINYNKIQNKLTAEEKNYFFKALIDCVVIDTEDNYKPKKFIELDSLHHDNEVRKGKDAMKNKILSVAGQKLIRIRRTTYKEDEKDFLNLIREVLR